MNLRSLYLRRKFWFQDWLKGSPIGRPYREIKFIQEHSYEEGLPLRKAALERLLKHVQAHSEFYSGFTSLDLRDYPVMNKMKLIENYEKLRVADKDIPGQVGEVYVQKTSGSTGTPLRIHHDTLKRQRRIAELKYFGEIVGFKSHDKLIHLRARDSHRIASAVQIKRDNIVPFDISRMSDHDMEELFDILRKEQPVCIRSYAGAFRYIADYARRHSDVRRPSKSLKISIAGGEMLSDDVRPLVKKYVGGDIISQYANEECGILGQERVPTADDAGVMDLNHAGYFIEVLKMDSDAPAEYGELGRIVLTDLHNYAFPVIRYDNGDAGMLLPPDERSHGYPILGKLFGRSTDVIYSTSGLPIHPISFSRGLKYFEEIRQWQFIQTAEKDYLVRICLVEGSDAESVKRIAKPLKNLVGQDANLSFEFVNEIPVLASGKRKMVVNEWKK